MRFESILIVAATRLDEAAFRAESALGRSLTRLKFDTRLQSRVFYQNTRGLSEVYNQVLDQVDTPDAVVFIHDDVWIDDPFFGDHILAGLAVVDIVGVVGTIRAFCGQSTWAFHEGTYDLDVAHLSGRIGHGADAGGKISYFGPSPAAVTLLDGVLLAVNRSKLSARGVRFDPQFLFDFYDLDFCATALHAGVKLATINLALTHQSDGVFGSERWRAARELYRAKWLARLAPAQGRPTDAQTLNQGSHQTISHNDVNNTGARCFTPHTCTFHALLAL
jgi:hypothetical protein